MFTAQLNDALIRDNALFKNPEQQLVDGGVPAACGAADAIVVTPAAAPCGAAGALRSCCTCAAAGGVAAAVVAAAAGDAI